MNVLPPLAASTAARSAYAAACSQYEAVLEACRRNLQLGTGIVLASMAAGFGLPGAPRLAFLVGLPLLVAQVFASTLHAERLRLGRACRAGRWQLPAERLPHCGWLGAALAVREGYLLLLLAFDTAWLGHAALIPVPVEDATQFLARLAIGPLSGTSLLAFTFALWFVYAVLFLVGGFVASEDVLENLAPFPQLPAANLQRVPFSLSVLARRGARVRLNGLRLPRPGAQALILWPGFFQNGLVFDLMPGTASLAEYLWQEGFDVWIVHPRGTAGSSGRELSTSLDDCAASDLPAIINFVSGKTPSPPILVGHSQGGITAVLSLLGASLDAQGASCLSDIAAQTRQNALGALVTLGSFPNFAVQREHDLQRFVRLGIPILGLHVPLAPLLGWLRSRARFVSLPIDLTLRRALLSSWLLRLLLLPLTAALEIAARLPFWEFLYHIPNVSTAARRHLLFATIDGTFTDVLAQFYRTVSRQRIQSLDGRVDYSEEYRRLRLPLSVVAMEKDGFVDQASLVEVMVAAASSALKFDRYLPRLGHEDLFMAPGYFALVLAAVRCVVPERALTSSNESVSGPHAAEWVQS